MSDAGKMTSLKKAARRFVELMPSEGADTILLAFNDQIEFLLDPVQFTSVKPRLLSAIDRLTPSGETRLWDAVLRGLKVLDASRAGLAEPPRLALIALTDGIDNRSDTRRIDVVIDAARRLNIPAYMLGLGPRHSLRENDLREVAVRTGGQFYHVPDAAQLTEVFERLSIDLHDDGIDERSLRRLAEQTGGEYCDVRQADRLSQTFERLAVQVDNTYTVTFRSRRDRADGTARGIEIRFGELARAVSEYKTYGLITPLSDPKLYLSTLAVLLLLLLLPRLRHR
jgi:VWFA-related protein